MRAQPNAATRPAASTNALPALCPTSRQCRPPAPRAGARGAQQSSATRRASVQCRAAATPAVFMAYDDRDLDEPSAGFDAIPETLAAVGRGEMVVVLDDEDRENEGDLIMAADKATPEAMAFMVRHTSGVVCVGMEGADLDRLEVPLMVRSTENEESMLTAFTVSVDLREGTSTGISAADRAKTIQALADPHRRPKDFKRPGHIFPLRYREGGVLRRPGHTEASVDLARLAGCRPAGVLCEVVSEDGSMARTPELLAFAARHGLRCITIADLVRYRLKHDRLVERTATAALPTRYGHFTAHAYRSVLDGTEHLALVAGNAAHGGQVLVRVHSESMLGDTFGSQLCDSGSQLDDALHEIAAQGAGVLVYLRGQQGRGLGLADELQAYAACNEDGGASARVSEMASSLVDLRDYGVAAHILRDLGATSIRLLTDNPAKHTCLHAHGIRVAGSLPMWQAAANGGLGAKGNCAAGGRVRDGCEPHFA